MSDVKKMVFVEGEEPLDLDQDLNSLGFSDEELAELESVLSSKQMSEDEVLYKIALIYGTKLCPSYPEVNGDVSKNVKETGKSQTYINPSPCCGHNDCYVVYEDKGIARCFSCNHTEVYKK